MSDTATESREVQRIRSGRDWSGYLTLENFDAVAGRLREMLEGKRYTWVSCNEGLRDFFPEVRPGVPVRVMWPRGSCGRERREEHTRPGAGRTGRSSRRPGGTGHTPA